MAEKEKILRIKLLGTKETQASLEKLQRTVDSLRIKRRNLTKAENKGLISRERASKLRLRHNTLLTVANTKLKVLTRQQLLANGAIKKGTGLSKSISKGFANMALRIGLATAAFLLIKNAIGGAINIVKNFQQANADLAAVLGKTRAEITDLSDNAKRLGGITKFTATEVLALSKEFAKLGFSTREILAATDATLDLAAATGTDLAEAARVTGATVRGFGLDASETQRVVDVMAKSFSSSALDMEKFATSMSKIAPVAKAVGLTIEETTGLMGTLADSGIEASIIGTSMRRIFIELSKKGLTLNEALKKIRNSQDKLNTANEIFGARAATAALVLAENADKAALLTEKLNEAGGAARRMAEEQLDTLQGSLTFLSSAWEKFILGMEDGEGRIGKTAKAIIDSITKIVQSAELIGKTTGEIIDQLGVEAAIESIQRLNDAFTDGSKKALAASKELRAVQIGLIRNETQLGEIREEIANTNAGMRAKAAKDAEKEIRQLEFLISRDREKQTLLKEIIKTKRDELALNELRKRSETDIIFLASQGVEQAQIVLNERIKASLAIVDGDEKEIEARKTVAKEAEKTQKQSAEIRKKFAEERRLALLSEEQRDIDKLNKRVEKLRKAGVDEVEIEKFIVEEKAKIRQKFRNKEIEEQTKNVAAKEKLLDQELESEILKSRLEISDKIKLEAVILELKRQRLVDGLALISLEIDGLTASSDKTIEIKQKENEALLQKQRELNESLLKLELKEKEVKAERDLEEDEIKAENNAVAKELALQAAQELTNTIFAIRNEARQREFNAALENIRNQFSEESKELNTKFKSEKEALKAKLKSDLAVQGLTDAQKEAIQAAHDKKLLALENTLDSAKDTIATKAEQREKDLRRKAFNDQKRADLLQAGINVVLSVVKTFATLGYPAGIAGAVAAAIVGAAQIAIIASKKFKRGGIADTGGVLEGASHAKGGIPFTVGGISGFEAQGGEPILTKGVGENPHLRAAASALNVAAGGVAFDKGGLTPIHRFQRGNVTPVPVFNRGVGIAQNALDIDQMAERIGAEIAGQIGDLRVVNVVSDTTDQQLSIENTESEASFG